MRNEGEGRGSTGNEKGTVRRKKGKRMGRNQEGG